MQLKRMEIQIEKNVAWNFRYDPSDIWHHELLDKRNNLSLIVSKTDPEWWAIYDRYQDADNCKRLMIFLPTNSVISRMSRGDIHVHLLLQADS